MGHPLLRPPRTKTNGGASYLAEDTIAAAATRSGGAVGIIRVSGPGARRIFEGAFCAGSSVGSNGPAPQKLLRGFLKDSSGERIDDVLCAWFRQPGSFTGEDVLEIHHHGSAFLTQRVLGRVIELGARQALPGEFSFRAVRNGKLSLTQAEALADLIEASNATAAGLALEKLSGLMNQLIFGIAEALRHLATLAEAGIDFSDQDLEELSLPALTRKLKDPLQALERLKASYKRGKHIQEGFCLALIGHPNAGKSSFFNALLGEDRSIVSDRAGTTRDVVGETLVLSVDQASYTFRIEDTAGLRQSSEPIELMGIERSLRSAKQADIVLYVVDSTDPDPDLKGLWDRAGLTPERVIGVLTKKDLASPVRIDTRLKECKEVLRLDRWVVTSTVTGEGVSEAAEEIVRLACTWASREAGEVLLTRFEHLQAVKSAIEHLERASQAEGMDLFAADIRHGLHALEPLIGETVPEDILGRVFSKFCIGK